MSIAYAQAVIIQEPKVYFEGDTAIFSVRIFDTKSNSTSPKNFRIITLNPGQFALGDHPPVYLEKEIRFPANIVYSPQMQVFNIHLTFKPQQVKGNVLPFILVMLNAYGQEIYFRRDDPTRKFKITDKLHPVFELELPHN